MSTSFHDICAEDELERRQSRSVIINDWPILICSSDSGLYAIINRCTHADSMLEGGRIRRNTISCPLHGARFDMRTGSCIGAHYQPLRTFNVQINAGRIEVEVPDAAPGSEYLSANSSAGR